MHVRHPLTSQIFADFFFFRVIRLSGANRLIYLTRCTGRTEAFLNFFFFFLFRLYLREFVVRAFEVI